MNREDIIRMAREQGLPETATEGVFIVNTDDLGRILAAERKSMMQLFTDPENQPTQHGTVTVEYMQREIIAEREACAKAADAHDFYGAAIAKDIRTRGQA